MKYFFISVIICFSATYSQAQYWAGARGAALGDASVAMNDVNAVFSNPAGTANLTQFSGVIYADRRFGSNAFNIFSAAACLPTKSGTWGVKLKYQGFSELNEQQVGLTYSRKIFSNFSIGAGFASRFVHAATYPNRAAFTFEIGAQAQIFKSLRLGVFTYNPVQIKRDGNADLPSILKVGLTYSPSDKVNINAEIEKDVVYKASYKGGVEYKLLPKLWLRAGYRYNPAIYSFGVGYQIKDRLFMDILAANHEKLGFIPGFSLSFK